MRYAFNTIQRIDPEDTGTFFGTIFLTLDIDWAHDEVIADALRLIEERNVPATWFATHQTDLLERIRGNDAMELGIHPNFNPLLSGDNRNGDAEEIVDGLLSIVPEAKSVRTHSLVQSTRLTNMYAGKGLTHESNIRIVSGSGIKVRPFIHPSGLVMCPYQWGDYNDLGDKISECLTNDQLFIVDFHPIHVFLNTEDLSRYERTRHIHHEPDKLIKHRFEGEGVRTRLLEVLELAEQPATSDWALRP